jgi:hypothetical protein
MKIDHSITPHITTAQAAAAVVFSLWNGCLLWLCWHYFLFPIFGGPLYNVLHFSLLYMTVVTVLPSQKAHTPIVINAPGKNIDLESVK